MQTKTGPFYHGNGRTSVVSFIANEFDNLVTEYCDWLPVSGYQCRELIDPGPDALAESITPPNRCAFIETFGRWTAYIDDDRIGNCPLSDLFCMAEQLSTECVSTVLMCETDDPTGCEFRYWDGRSGEVRSRTIQLVRDDKWEFHQYGEPLPFEDLIRYTARKVSERFSNNMVLEYASKLEIYLNDRSFFTGRNRVFELILNRNSS